MKEYKERPNDFSRQIIAEGSVQDIRKLEAKILSSVKASTNDDFYNRHNNDGLFFEGWKKENISENHRKNMSLSASKRKRTKEHIEKLHQGRRNSKNSKEHIEAIKASKVDYKHSEETRKKISDKLRLNPESIKYRSSKAGKSSAQKRKESGYYKSEAYLNNCKKGWETRRARLSLENKGGIVNGD